MASLYRSLIFLLSTAAIQVQGGKHGIKDVDHQTQPESQLLTLHTNPQSTGAELICPTYVEQTELTSYFLIQNNEEHSRFAKGEDTYFKSEYHLIKQLNIGWFDNIHLAVKKSSGVKVICKFIRKLGQEFYTVESSPPPECHNTEVSTLDGNHVGAECMSPRPSDLLLPLEIGLQKYLSQPVYENPYVLRVTDYAVTSQAYVLVMEYAGEDWVTFDRYMKEHVKFSVDEVRSIMKELVTALVFLKNLGVLHGSIIEQNMLYNRKTGHMKLINFAFSEPREGWNQDNSVQAKSSDSASRFFDYRPEVLDREMKDIENISYFLLLILTLERPYKDTFNHLEGFTKGFRDRLEDPESQSAVDAADLMATLFGYGSYQITSMEVILTHSFFTRQ